MSAFIINIFPSTYNGQPKAMKEPVLLCMLPEKQPLEGIPCAGGFLSNSNL